MKMLDLIKEQAVVAQIEGNTREQIITELLDALIAAGGAPEAMRDELIAKVMEREMRGSTGFGKGVAVPHAKHDQIKKLAAAVGVSQNGVDFNALDKQPVYSFILLLSPGDDPDKHLEAMEVIFKNLSMDNFRRFLKQSSTAEDVMTLLHDADNQQLPA